MRVKRYVVDSVSDALPLIRSELGSDAVILSTKDIKVGGFMGMFRKRKTEVVAAVESETPKSKPRAKPAPQSVPSAPQRPMAAAAAAYAGKQPFTGSTATAVLTHEQHDSEAAVAERAAALIHAAVSQGNHSQARGNPAVVSKTNAVDKESSRVVPAPDALTSSAATKQEKRLRLTSEEALVSEIRDMKEWIMKLSRQQASENQSPALIALSERLEEQEVSSVWIEKLLDELQQQSDEANGWDDAKLVWEAAFALLSGWLTPYEHPGIQSEDRIVYFVGPTGVGKTTTIAKLAAEQTLKGGRKVGFITSDTYRIAAVDQLRTYANILNVPMEVVFSPNEVPRAFERLADQQLIFMDTAGRNYRSELHVSEVHSMLNNEQAGIVFLVMSMTGRTRDMMAVTERFLPYGVKQVVFTKLDETSVYGALLNMVLEFGLTPAYVTSGQTVPDDIAPFRAEAYVKLLLGDPEDV